MSRQSTEGALSLSTRLGDPRCYYGGELRFLIAKDPGGFISKILFIITAAQTGMMDMAHKDYLAASRP